jgi:DNA primase
VNPYETSNWEKHQIFFSKEEELVPKIVEDVLFRHKREYVVKLINDMKTQLSAEADNDETYRKIIMLMQLKNTIDEKLFRIL